MDIPVAPAVFIVASAALLYYTFTSNLRYSGQPGYSGWNPGLLRLYPSSLSMRSPQSIREASYLGATVITEVHRRGTFTHLVFFHNLSIGPGLSPPRPGCLLEQEMRSN